MKRTTRSAGARTRREFMKLLAAGSAAVLASPRALAETAGADPKSASASGAKSAAGARLTRTRVEPGARVALPAEIEKQKKYLADTLKVLREYPLPPGSPQAFSFRVLAPRRRKRGG